MEGVERKPLSHFGKGKAIWDQVTMWGTGDNVTDRKCTSREKQRCLVLPEHTARFECWKKTYSCTRVSVIPFLSQHRWLTTSSSLLFLTPHVWWLLQKCYTLGKFWGDSSLLRWHYTTHAVHGLSSIGTSISLSHWVTQRWYSSQKFAQWGVQYMAFWDFWAATWSY